MAKIENILERRRVREIGRLRDSEDSGDSGNTGDTENTGDSGDVTEVGNAVWAGTWGAKELGNWGLGRFRRLDVIGDWGIR